MVIDGSCVSLCVIVGSWYGWSLLVICCYGCLSVVHVVHWLLLLFMVVMVWFVLVMNGPGWSSVVNIG